jgi:formate hydrogenlyase subunit 3/multisubunit Na+/H+ antiporter MnhD subunit
MSLFTIALPLAGALFAIFLKKTAKYIALITSAVALVISIVMFASPESSMSLLSLHATLLSSGAFLAASFITLLTIIYSMGYMDGDLRENEYYSYVLVTLAAAAGVFFANDFLTLLVFWGILGATLYMLIGIGRNAERPAMKAFMIAGTTDALMIVGIALVMGLTHTLQIGFMLIPLNNPVQILAYLLLACAALAKAGAMPFHTWIADAAEHAPTPVMALLPASLDKILGIYLLFRISTDVFLVLPGSTVSILLMGVGSFTVLAAVMAALIQHDLKKLLSFHAVSQVGYMIMGIGCANSIGLAGALFHMLNNAVFKSCLFFTAGSVEKKTGTTDLDRLGGLGKVMPITFISALIASFSISGVPPFNGFFSKWMIYQGIVQTMDPHNLWIIWLTVAMVGSALTMASFVKILHAVFLGRDVRKRDAGEVSAFLWAPAAVLAAVCVLFGIFAFQVPLPFFIFKVVPTVIISGYYNPIFTAGLLIVGLVIGLLIYYMSRSSKTITKPSFVGGEIIEPSLTKVSGTEFYNTVKDIKPLKFIFDLAAKGMFDIYNLSVSFSLGLFSILSDLYDGFLGHYISWMLLGGILIWLILSR